MMRANMLSGRSWPTLSLYDEGNKLVLDAEVPGLAEDELRTATRLIEDKKLSEARKLHPALITRYADLEVRALKEGTKAVAGN